MTSNCNQVLAIDQIDAIFFQSKDFTFFYLLNYSMAIKCLFLTKIKIDK